MENWKSIEPFGLVHIPPLSNSELTASYLASDWTCLNRPWELVMYWTMPGSGKPVEMPSITRGVRAADYLPPVREKTWDQVMEEVLHDRAEAWQRLAQL